MREIKFRAWHAKKKIMYLPQELGQDDMTISANGKGFLNVSGVHPKFTQEMPWLIPMQYTGLPDKNGKEIYEGDIVRAYHISPLTLNTHPEGFMEVVYESGYFGVRDLGTAEGRVANVCFVDPDDWLDVSIVGNIYENPELVEGK